MESEMKRAEKTKMEFGNERAEKRKMESEIKQTEKTKMKFHIERAVESDAKELFGIMMSVWEQLEDKSLYYADDQAYIEQCIQNDGVVLKALDQAGKIAAFLLMYIPKDDAEHLGHMCKMKEEQREATVYMDSIAVLPEYRGYGLQKRLLQAGEKKDILPEKRYLMATVAPENIHSLHNFLSLGYNVICEARKYGGLRRLVLLKERSGNDETRRNGEDHSETKGIL